MGPKEGMVMTDKGDSIATKVVKATGIVVLLNLLSRVLGFVRDAVIAREFGASGATDAYLVAYTLPYALQAVLGMAFVSVIVPVITTYLVKGEKRTAWQVVSIVFNWVILILIALTAIGILAAPMLIKLLAPGFSLETHELTVVLTRIIFPSIIFMGAGMLLTGVLNASGIFGVPAFAPAFANIIVIISVLLFAGRFRVYGLAAGTVVAFIGFFMLHLPGMRALGYHWSWNWDRKHPAVRRVLSILLPLTLSIAINQIYLAVNRIFASGLEPGSITALDFAYRLMVLPVGIFVAAISTAIYPAFSDYATKKDLKGLAESLLMGMAMVSVIAIPSAIGLMAVREPLIKVVFQRGAFDYYATQRTAVALWYFSLGLWAVGANLVVTRAYYAIENIRTPLALGMLCAVLNVILSMLLMPAMGHGGLALANSLAVTINIVLLLLYFKRYLVDFKVSRLLLTIGKSLTAAVIMGLLVSLLKVHLSGMLAGGGMLASVLQLFLLAITGVVVYILLLVALRTSEVEMIKKVIFRK
jgi:putative peptidoglycan lipid II flippase